jgi:hypothetical protein
VLIAAPLVDRIPLFYLRILVLVVVLYTAIRMLRSAAIREGRGGREGAGDGGSVAGGAVAPWAVRGPRSARWARLRRVGFGTTEAARAARIAQSPNPHAAKPRPLQAHRAKRGPRRAASSFAVLPLRA